MLWYGCYELYEKGGRKDGYAAQDFAATFRYCHTGINVLSGSEPRIHYNMAEKAEECLSSAEFEISKVTRPRVFLSDYKKIIMKHKVRTM